MSEIVYRLTASVDDTVVFSSDYPDTAELQSAIDAAEIQVERYIEREEDLLKEYED